MNAVRPEVSTGPDAITSLARALRLLQAASPDWQRKGPTDGSEPLHWPAAVAAAQAHIAHALRLMERSYLFPNAATTVIDHGRHGSSQPVQEY
jgi:hypothetical protein